MTTEADASPRSLRLTVESAGPLDADRGLARLPRSAMAALGLRAGEVVRIEGARAAHARVMPSRAAREAA